MIRRLPGFMALAMLFAGAMLSAGPAVAADPAPPETVYAVRCLDSADGHARRAVLRPEHIAYLRKIKDSLAVAGGITGPDGKGAAGSLVIYHAATLDAAKALLANDPLSRGNVYGSCEWSSFPAVIGTWVKGGILAPDAPAK